MPESPHHDSRSLKVLDIVREGLCVGCGVCGAQIALNPSGCLQAVTDGEEDVCPFGDNENEDRLAEGLYATLRHDQNIGYYHSCYAGHVKIPPWRSEGSSGGIAKFIASEALRRGWVDGVIQVVAGRNPLFGYTVQESCEEVSSGSKSAYYPVTLSEVLRAVRGNGKRYWWTVLPCFAKALRLLAKRDSEFARQAVFIQSLFCGHMKSAFYADLHAWTMGIRDPDSVDFRVKDPSRPANQFHTEATKGKVARSAAFSRGWSRGYFKYEACEYCDDVVGETADICIGDAWIAPYRSDPQGTNILVVRNPRLLELLDPGSVHLEPITPRDVVASQKSSIRYRKQWIKSRLAVFHKAVSKRVVPEQPTEAERRRTLLLEEIRLKSFSAYREALERNDLAHFNSTMDVFEQEFARLMSRKGRKG